MIPWPAAELPVVDSCRCTGCGDCVALCPVECLVMTKVLPELPRPADCVSCALCVAACPVDALQMALK